MYEVIKQEHAEDVIKKTDAEGKIFWIPVDEANSDYQAYLESLKK